MLEAAPPRHVDLDHFPNGQRRAATRADDAISLPNLDLFDCNHDVPFRGMSGHA